jgi:hypothetical protein
MTRESQRLFAAVERGDLAGVKRAIANGAEANSRGRADMTPLLTACFNGFLNIAKALVKAGADTWFRNKHQWTALTMTVHGAAMSPENRRGVASPRSHVALLKYLLDRGGDPRERHKGETLLQMAEASQYSSPRPEKLIPILKKAIASTRGGRGARRPVQVIEETYDVDPRAPFTPPDFSRAARRPAFREAVKNFTRRFGKPVRHLFQEDAEPLPVFTLTPDEAERVVSREQAGLMKKSVFVCRTREPYPAPPARRGGAHVALFPTGDVFEVLAVAGTGGGFEGAGAAVTRLRRIAADDPFRLTFISEDTVEGEFLRPPKDATTLAERIEALCPGSAADDDDDFSGLAKRLKKSRRLFLWWD